MKYVVQLRRHWWKYALVAAAAACAVGIFLVLRPDPLLPRPLSRQVTSTVFLPNSVDAVINRSSYKYNPSEKVLSLTAGFAGTTMTLSEQPTPDSFTDIPEVYQKVVAQMNNYESFESKDGTVHLTKPSQLAGQQTAVLNAKGTLLFIKPSKNLSTDQWKLFFRSLKTED
jgi:hypothetical protein